MGQRYVIDLEARFQDHVTGETGPATRSLKGLGEAAEQAQGKIGKLVKTKAQIEVDANNTKFVRKIREAEAKAHKLGRTKTTMVLNALDKATVKINKVIGHAKNFAAKTYNAILKVMDSQAVKALGEVGGTLKHITGRTWSTIVKIKDYATAPLRKIKDSLFSIKSLIAAVTAGVATKQLIMDPVGLADTIESSRIAFTTKLGSEEKAEEFLQSIYKFDEKSPFDTMEIVGITQQMMNLGWTAEDVLKDLGTIGDWSASLGKGEEGISAVTRALGQMRMKGKLSSEEMLQLTEAGVNGWQYLADYLGTDIPKVREMAEDNLIDVNTAITGIMAGMSEYSGSAAATADRRVSGLKDQVMSLFKTYVALPWGEGLGEGFRDALTQVRDVIDENKDALKGLGTELKEVGKAISGWVADRAENAIRRIKEITSGDAFKNASITGKINMLWDGVIANPFSKWWKETVIPWWDDTAVPWLETKASKLGKNIGSGLTKGLMALLGIDYASAIEDGSNIAGGFVNGFLEGFDGAAITDAFVDAITNVWRALPGWAKLLIGGTAIYKTGVGAASVIGNVKALIGTAGGQILADGSVAPATGLRAVFGSTGNYMVSGTGMLGSLAKLGYNATGGPASAAAYFGHGMSGAAAAGIGGGIVAGIGTGIYTAGSGVVDIYKGSKNNDDDSINSGLWKITGAGGGAALGAAIGTAFGGPLIGTAIGALVGSGVGWLQSNQIKKNAVEAAQASGTLEELAASESIAAKKAQKLLDEMRALAKADMAEHFGDVALSADQVKSAVKDLIGQDVIDRATAASDALAQLNSSMESFRTADYNLNRSLWDTTLADGKALSDDEISKLKSSYEAYSDAASALLDDKQYASEESINALLGDTEDAKNVLKASKDYYAQTRKQLKEKTTEFTKALEKALDDNGDGKINFAVGEGVISLDEEKSLQEIRSQISRITAQIEQEQYTADMNIIKAKFSTDNINVESFGLLMDELESTNSEVISSFWDEFGAASVGLEEGSDAWNTLLEGTLTEIANTLQNAGDLGMDKLQSRWAKDLGILGHDLSDILANNTGPEITAAAENLSKETRASIDAMLDHMAPTTEQIQELVESYRNAGLEDKIPEALLSYLNTTEFYEALSAGPKAVENFFRTLEIDIEPKGFNYDASFEEWQLNAPLGQVFEVEANVKTNWTYDAWDDEWIAPDETISFTTEALVKAGWTYNPFEEQWISPGEAYTFGTNGEVNVSWLVDKFGDKVLADGSTNATFGVNSSYTASTTVDLYTKYNVIPSQKKAYDLLLDEGYYGAPGGQGYRGGIFGGDSAMDAFARGGRTDNSGIVGGSTRFIRVNEESPEMIIPLSSQRRDRAIDLWEKTGELLGVDRYARGGYVGRQMSEGFSFRAYDADDGVGGRVVQVDMGGVTVEFHVDVSGGQSVAEAIQAQAPEIAEMVAGIINDAIGAQFENTPTKGGAA